jgi:hypothetical protein
MAKTANVVIITVRPDNDRALHAPIQPIYVIDIDRSHKKMYFIVLRYGSCRNIGFSYYL